MSIKPLSQHTTKRLTTAQIVTSVFSVVKELVENSIDAGANDIAITLVSWNFFKYIYEILFSFK